MLPPSTPEFPYPEFIVKCHPETVMSGDTLYIKITAKNPYEKSIWISDNFWPTDCDIQVHLRDSENREQPLLFESPTSKVYDRGLWYAEIKPGDSRIIGALAINVPPLEDLKEPFWEKQLKSLSAKDEKFSLCVTVITSPSTDGRSRFRNEDLPITLEMPITMKQRPEKEMTLIQKWRETQPYFPKTEKYRKVANTGTRQFMPQNTVVDGLKYSHWYFVRIGNRHPSEPNVPETWQELEDSLTPSTMRDEIRLTRILIQYCDTGDEDVLKELKEWFDSMNEVQRTCMAKSVFDRLRDCSNNQSALFAPFRDLYRAIHKYDIAAKSGNEEEYLRLLRSLE